MEQRIVEAVEYLSDQLVVLTLPEKFQSEKLVVLAAVAAEGLRGQLVVLAAPEKSLSDKLVVLTTGALATRLTLMPKLFLMG